MISLHTRDELAHSSNRTLAVRASSSPLELLLRAVEDESVCTGDASLRQCGAPFPSDFCCPTSAKCLQLDSSAIAVLCCPAGSDCKFVSPISCDEQAQNSTLFPGNQLHSNPTMPLDECDGACCPIGSTCHDGVCAVSTLSAFSSATTTTSRALRSTITSRAEDITSSYQLPAATSESSNSLDGAAISEEHITASSKAFSGKSFVAGLFPGIVIGILIVALIVWCLDRRRRHARESPSDGYSDRKHFSTADQLTSLSTDSHFTLPTHTRSISQPISDPSNGHRTDFVRGTPSPPRSVDPLNHDGGNYVVTATGPITPVRSPRIRAFLSRPSIFQSPPSPQPSQLPTHMKRGTLTHTYITAPMRALRSKKSSHSLRREMNASAAAYAADTLHRRDQRRPRISPGGSEETIRVLMPQVELEACSSDQRKMRAPVELDSNNRLGATSAARDSDATWATVSSSPLFPEPIRLQELPAHQTPTRIPASQVRTLGRDLGAPQPTQNRLGPSVHPDMRRQTTFSGFMEKAGIRPGVN